MPVYVVSYSMHKVTLAIDLLCLYIVYIYLDEKPARHHGLASANINRSIPDLCYHHIMTSPLACLLYPIRYLPYRF